MLDRLSSSLKEAVRKIVTSKRIDKRTVDELVRDLQRALIQADVKISIVKELSNRVRERALKEKLVLNPREHVIKVLYEELIGILGKSVDIPLTKQKILMVGLHGSGKTSSCAKLARYFQKKGLKPAVICADVYRPAASDQLKQLCSQISVPFFDSNSCGKKDVIEIVKAGVKEFARYDVQIIDTAGRHALESDMIDELRRISAELSPEQRLLVLDAAIGQQASRQAKAFDEAIGITGIIITKMDGTAKGGGALSAVEETGSGIAFLGTGEKLDDFERFEPDRFVSRLLGMGDIKTLIELADERLDKEELETTLRGKFTLNDLYAQLEALRKMGPFKKLIQMLPLGGLDLNIDDALYQVTEDKLKRFRVIMDSMTEEERNEPKIIDGSRLRRIATGSGTTTAEVKELLKYHRMMQRMIKSFSSTRGRGKIPTMRGIPLKMMKNLK